MTNGDKWEADQSLLDIEFIELTEHYIKQNFEYQKRKKLEEKHEKNPPKHNKNRKSVKSADAAETQRLTKTQNDDSFPFVKATIPEKPHIDLEAGRIIPEYLCSDFPEQLVGVPLVDPDPHYADKGTYVVIDAQKTIYRFSLHYALYAFGPLNPIRRVTSKILTMPIFNNLIICTILLNCYCMTLSTDDAKVKKILDDFVE